MDGSFLLKTLRYCVSGIQPRFTMRLLVEDKRLPRSSLRGGPMWVFLSFLSFDIFEPTHVFSSFIFFWFLICWSFFRPFLSQHAADADSDVACDEQCEAGK